MKYWYHKTTIGTFYIVKDRNDYDIMFEGDCLGTYDDPQNALDNLVSGHTPWLPYGDPSTFNIPEELEEWQEIR